MILQIVSSLIFSNQRRTVIEVLPPRVRKLWKEWDLRLTVVGSLVLQIILVLLGHRRKHKQSQWIRGVVWSAYLAADSTAIFALGILSNNLTENYYEHPRSVDANTELTAFWAPFLLLHLGGPDTITAYSLEDNQLWPRHLAALVIQTIITIYVFLLTWTGSWLSILFILMFFAGFVKYGERNYTLRSASNEKLRESLFTPSQFGPRDGDMFARENKSRQREGYRASLDVVPDYQLSVDLSIFTIDKSLSTEEKLVTISEVLDVTKRLFLSILLPCRDRDRIKSVFRNISTENAFEVVEIELGLIYDLLYTKAPLICTPWGLALRGISFTVVCYVLVVFTFLHHKNRYSRIDVTITFLLLIGGVILDVYSAILLLISDQFHIWLSKHRRTCGFFRAVTSFPQSKERWSQQICQWSLLRSFTREEPLPCRTILKIPKIGKFLEKRRHKAFKVPKGIKALILRCIKELVLEYVHRSIYFVGVKSFVIIPTAGRVTRGNWGGTPQIENEFGNCILFWHIVTEVSYKLDEGKRQFEEIVEHCKLIKHISRYMGYLLVKYPSVLSLGADKIALNKTIDKAIEELRGAAKKVQKEVKQLDRRQKKIEACENLVKLFQPAEDSSRNSSNKLLSDALKFADRIREEEDLTEKWNRFGSNWLQMLFLAATRSEGREHAQQLRRGGEFFTHVWLLMAHLGANRLFQITDQNIDGIKQQEG